MNQQYEKQMLEFDEEYKKIMKKNKKKKIFINMVQFLLPFFGYVICLYIFINHSGFNPLEKLLFELGAGLVFGHFLFKSTQDDFL